MRHALRLLWRGVGASLLGLDLLASGLTGGAPGESISARLAKARLHGSALGTLGADGIDWLALKGFGVMSHCAGSLAAYQARQAVAPWLG